MEGRAAQDQRLVDSCLQGDPAAFAELVAEYQGLVASVAWRLGIRQADVEDMVSEIFIKTYRNLHRYRPDHPFATWLYRLAVNHVIDQKRRERKEHGRSEMPTQLADPRPGAGTNVEDRERATLLRGALQEVKAHYREVLQLVYLEEMKIDEVARTLGLPTGTVKTRLMRGRDALRQILLRRHPRYFEA